MSNSYFQFKQFIIHQDRCAMKVTTDACILGAWFAGKIAPGVKVLDIGSGTGLLMLMLAQKHDAEIQGIELDASAFEQLQENIAQSPWKDRLQPFHGDVRNFSFTEKFRFIISNPPFFEDDLPADSSAKNLARHSQALKLSELIVLIDAQLEATGVFGILLPYHRESHFEEIATGRGFHLREKLRLRQTAGHGFFRTILHFSREEEDPARKDPVLKDPAAAAELIIRTDTGEYSAAFVELMKDYYLYL
jgi:tRNA1Val (adenine37-N6)-methyltransferase